MPVMSSARELSASACRLSSRYRTGLDREVLVYGAAIRRQRAQAIKDDIDHACEMAALGSHRCLSRQSRDTWDKRTWARYLAEAVRQAHIHCLELDALRQGAAQLERLARDAGPGSETTWQPRLRG